MYPPYTDSPLFVTSGEQLAELCDQWSKRPMLALDTEFIRTDTFYPIGALIQVSDDRDCFLIDPLVIDDLSPFGYLLADTTIVKVLHSCSEDLEVFDRLFKVLPEPVFDTQIAAAMDGLGFSLSYQRLTDSLLDIHVPKGETRSNWLQRPLTESQVHYAALDVAYLPEIHRRLSESLTHKGRLTWLREDGEALLAAYHNNTGDRYYRRVKSAWRLDAEKLALLQSLIAWREQTARDRDRPRGHILKDNSCFDIVRSQPKDLRELAAIADVGPKTVRRYGEQILAVIRDRRRMDNDPEPLPPPLPPETRALARRLKSHVQSCAQQLQVAAEILARKKDLEALLRSGLNGSEYRLPDSLDGWRKAVIGDELLTIARQC